MRTHARISWFPIAFTLVGACQFWLSGRAMGQFGEVNPPPQYELSDNVQLDVAEGALLANVERVKAYLANRRWEEAVETLRQLMENSEDKLAPVGERRYINMRDYCQMQLAALPAEALKLYRGRVDAAAKKWYEDGTANRDRRALQNVVDRYFASSWGDKALLALGELAMESGDFAAARWHWQRIIPARLPNGQSPTWLNYPDTSLDLAAVRARLVLVSILEGSTDRARDELNQFSVLHKNSRGRLGGREVDYANALSAMLAESAAWPSMKQQADWPTFAGSLDRNAKAAKLIDVGEVLWRLPLKKVKPAMYAGLYGETESPDAPLSYNPVLVGDLVLINNQVEIRAFRASTGKPAWGSGDGAIYRDKLGRSVEDLSNPDNTFGTARCTMTVCEGRLYARMGRCFVGRPQDAAPRGGNHLVCLDLTAEGQLLWETQSDTDWLFEGSPVSDGSNVYVASRRGGVLSRTQVACYDAATGRLRWRRMVCAADAPGGDSLCQCANNLLTLDHGTIYYNTNLGAAAAISAEDGRLLWVTLYPRQRTVNPARPAPHWQRDLNPCVFDRGTLLLMPADNPAIFALDAFTGQILWQTGPQLEDADDLLGVAGDWLIAGGRRLYWIGLKTEDAGRIKRVWPDGSAAPGRGRGVLAGDSVLFPTREYVNGVHADGIRVFDQKTAQLKKYIDLRYRGDKPAACGNLFIGGGQLLVATGAELIALGRRGTNPSEIADTLTMRGITADD
jgi:cellulose synthase operon protein C